ncbi:MAG TPA: alpha-galactosidase [Phototrophicaceae bacterium]|nr:alpha-galactosidase [Phototrophicaceae bacterium]
MAIVFDAERNIWALHSPSLSYGIGVDRRGRLKNIYFGANLPNPAEFGDPDFAYPGGASFDPSDGPAQFEYPTQTGMYYDEPCLKATFSDHVRDVALVYASQRQETVGGIPTLIITLRDTYYPLRVHLHYRIYEDCDLIERFAVIENTGDTPITLEQVLSGIWHLPRGREYRFTHLAGRHTQEFQLHQDKLTPGRKVIESRRGNTSHQANPWFAVDHATATEEYGEVWFGALAWSGNWKISAEYAPTTLLQISGGVNDFDFAWDLKPGESFTTPAFIGGYTCEGFGQASRNLHRYELKHVLPDVSQPRPVIYNGWEAIFFDVNEQNQLALIDQAAEIGVELFCIDDGWFGARASDNAGLGDWTPTPSKFPNGLLPVADKVHARGMKFGLWVEPEMVNPDSDLYRAHPDWAYNFPHRPRTESRHQLVLNFARPDVREYIFNALDDLVSRYQIDFFKWDMNRSFSEPGWIDADPAQQREIWVRHVQSLYDIMGRLRAKHPTLTIESCSGGGGRVDLGVMPYVDQVWTSDNTDAHDRLAIQAGFSMAYCARSMECWVTKSGHNIPSRDTTLEYRFHSAMMGSLGVSLNLALYSADELAEMRRLIAQYKEIRHIVQGGDLYRLIAPGVGIASAVQYVTGDQSEAVVFVMGDWPRFQQLPPLIYLRGLLPAALYSVSGEAQSISGQALMMRGLDVRLSGDLRSRLIVLKRVR